MMPLYNVPAGSKIIVVGDPEMVVYKFFNIDGMYSYCTDKDGNVVHLAAWTEVEIVE
jgi:hypothetical protein